MNMKHLSHPLVWAGALVIALGVAAAFYYASRLDVPVPVSPDDAKPAPDFALPDLTGKTVRLEDFRGKVVLLNLWTPGCEPCRDEIEALSRLQVDYRKKLAVAGVALNTTAQEAARFIEPLKATYPMLLADEQFAKNYAAGKLPKSVLIDRHGRLRSLMAHPPKNLYDHFYAFVGPIVDEADQ